MQLKPFIQIIIIVLFFIGICVVTSCKKQDKTLPLCDSEFTYQDSTYRYVEGITPDTIMPTYISGADIPGLFYTKDSGLVLDSTTGIINLAASQAGSYVVYKAMLGNTACANHISLGYVTILGPAVAPVLFANTSNSQYWGGVSMWFDPDDTQNGYGSVKSTITSGTLQLIQYQPDTVVATEVTQVNGQLRLWFYISDPEAYDQDAEIGQFEIGSGSGPDVEETTFPIILSELNLTAGWNLLKLNFADANSTGGSTDYTALNWFRVYMFNTETTFPLTIGVSDVEIWDSTY
ncbi:hypothetical protein [Parafilimonas sp.]|uniref:hypothetical protein n=1 Tax=Parafilimonas sp. TaxID=1969739 RepID=UPI0039E3BAF0